MAELEQKLIGLTAKRDVVFQLVSNKKYRAKKLPFTSRTIWKGNRYGSDINKIFCEMGGGKLSLNQADREITHLMKEYYNIGAHKWF
tara:strand:+ start:37 stop:297 length:261 start_codon:yes stop_codon:yes gene_type:complete